MNQALLAKWAWKYLKGEANPWWLKVARGPKESWK